MFGPWKASRTVPRQVGAHEASSPGPAALIRFSRLSRPCSNHEPDSTHTHTAQTHHRSARRQMIAPHCFTHTDTHRHRHRHRHRHTGTDTHRHRHRHTQAPAMPAVGRRSRRVRVSVLKHWQNGKGGPHQRRVAGWRVFPLPVGKACAVSLQHASVCTQGCTHHSRSTPTCCCCHHHHHHPAIEGTPTRPSYP